MSFRVHAPFRCPNCAAAYAPQACFCTACGRARDVQDVQNEAKIACARPDPNPRLLREPGHHRTRSVPSQPRRSAAPVPTPPAIYELPFVLPRPGPGVIFAVAVVFFGLVFLGRAKNGPRPVPPHAPIVAFPVTSALRFTPEEDRQFEARTKRDLHDAESYSQGLRAEAAANVLQETLRNSQATPPSAETRPYNTVRVPPTVSYGK